MGKIEKRGSSEHGGKTKEFIKKNWPIALAVSGAAGVVGATVWLTARYLRNKKQREIQIDAVLKGVEDEIEATSDGTVAMLETGTYLGEIAGEEGLIATDELADQADDPETKAALKMLKEVIVQNKRR